MSKSNDFVKRENAEFSTQLTTFSDGVNSATAPNGATVGLTGGEIAEAKADAKYMAYVNQQQDKSQDFAQAYTKFRKDLRKGSDTPIIEPVFNVPATVPTAVLAGVEDRFRKKVAAVKAHANYTPAIGEAWGIVADEASADLGLPEFEIVFAGNHPVLRWKKKTADAIRIEKDKGQGWYHADNDIKSPWADKDDLPPAGQSAVWKYRIIYLINDEQVGAFSAPQIVTVGTDVSSGQALAN